MKQRPSLDYSWDRQIQDATLRIHKLVDRDTEYHVRAIQIDTWGLRHILKSRLRVASMECHCEEEYRRIT